MLIMFDNDVEINPGPIGTSEQFGQCQIVTKNRTSRYSPELLSANHVGKENPVSIGSVARIFSTGGGQ